MIRTAMVLATCGALAACGRGLGGDFGEPSGGPADAAADAMVRVDGGSLDDDGSVVQVGSRCPVDAPLSMPMQVAWTPTDIRSVRFGTTTIFMAAMNAPHGVDLYAASRAADGGTGTALSIFAPLNSDYGDTFPAVTSDELYVVFQRNDTGSLFATKRAQPGGDFSVVAAVGMQDLPGTGAREPYLVGDRLYFARAVSAKATEIFVGSLDRSGNAVTNGTDLPELGSAAEEGFPVVSADETEIFFVSTRGGPRQQVLHAKRAGPNGAFEPPQVVSALDDPAFDSRPTFLSPDGCTLYSIRSATGSNADSRLWVATRR